MAAAAALERLGLSHLTAERLDVAAAAPDAIRAGFVAQASAALDPLRALALLQLIDRLEGEDDAAALLAAAHLTARHSAAA